MNIITNNNGIVREIRQPSPYIQGADYYWTWTGSSERVIANRYPAKVISRDFYASTALSINPEQSRMGYFLKTRGGKMGRKTNWLIFSLAMVLYLIHSAAPSPAIHHGVNSAASVSTLSEVEGLTFFGFISLTCAEEEKDEKIETKEVIGEVSVIRPSYISVITERDKEAGSDTEMVFIIDDEVKFSRKTLNQLKEGDKIRITFDKVSETTEEGEEKFKKRVTKKVEFLSSATTSLSSQ